MSLSGRVIMKGIPSSLAASSVFGGGASDGNRSGSALANGDQVLGFVLTGGKTKRIRPEKRVRNVGQRAPAGGKLFRITITLGLWAHKRKKWNALIHFIYRIIKY